MKFRSMILLAGTAALMLVAGNAMAQQKQLLNVSYDPTRELYRALSTSFSQDWQAKHGASVTVESSHGGSGKQARAVIDGLEADVVTLALAYDIDSIASQAKLLPTDWQKRLPDNSEPYTSTIVFLVRKGNPKQIKDWNDLIKPGVEIVTPNPASSGSARWNALAAWGHITENGGTEEEATAFIEKLFSNVVSLTSSGRDATTSFLGGTGDVILAYENEAILAAQNGEGFDYVIPETTLLIENPGAILAGSAPVAEDWLDFVLGEEGQRQFVLTGFRPVNTEDPGAVDWDALGRLRGTLVMLMAVQNTPAIATRLLEAGRFS